MYIEIYNTVYIILLVDYLISYLCSSSYS